MKLSNIFPTNHIIVAKAPHGILQSGQSMDLYANDPTYSLIAPADGYVDLHYNNTKKSGLGNDMGFSFVINNTTRILFHHAVAAHTKGGVKKGDFIGHYNFRGYPIHIHTAININNQWDLLLNYVSRSVLLLPEVNGRKTMWTNWNTYLDRKLKLDIIYQDMQIKTGIDGAVKVQNLFKVVAQPSVVLRSSPNTKASILNNIPHGTVVSVNTYAIGEIVNNNDLWLKVQYKNELGYISARWVVGVDKDSDKVNSMLKDINQIRDLSKNIEDITNRY